MLVSPGCVILVGRTSTMKRSTALFLQEGRCAARVAPEHPWRPQAVKIVGYGFPSIAILAVMIFHNPNATGDARPLLWLVPASCFVSGTVLWRAFVTLPEHFRWGAFVTGAFAILFGWMCMLVLILFDGWLHH